MSLLERNLDQVIDRYPRLSGIRAELKASAILLAMAVKGGKKILCCGNGGSASDAEHIVGELVKSFAIKRPIASDDEFQIKAQFPAHATEILANLEGYIPAMSLCSSLAFNTAFANDKSYEFAFAQQAYALGCEGDVLVAISTSGNSKNVVNAARVARVKGIKVIGLTGSGGGALSEVADICVRAPADKVHEIQELHLPIYHFLCYFLEQAFFTEQGKIEQSDMFENHQDVQYTIDQSKSSRGQGVLAFRPDLIVFDFDGVFTDNRVLTLQDGTEGVFCNRSDGLGIGFLKKANIPMLILSTEQNHVVKARAEKLKLECIFGCDDKRSALMKICSERNIEASKVVFLGNDVNDLEAMQFVGFSVAPSDAYPAIKDQASLVLKNRGGHGAVRELAELVLRNS